MKHRQIRSSHLQSKFSCEKFDDEDLCSTHHNCLTEIFITILRSFHWCFRLFYMIFLELGGQYFISKSSSNDFDVDFNSISMKKFDFTAANNSADENPSTISKTSKISKKNSNATRVTVRRSISNQNLDEIERKVTTNLGTINSHIVVRPILSKTNVDQREQLADAQCRRSHEPMFWMSRSTCCSHCRPMCQPMPFCSPCLLPKEQSKIDENEKQQQQQHENILSAKESAPIVQRSLSSIKSLSTRTQSERNQSVDQETQNDDSSSQTTQNDVQLKFDTQHFVDDLIQTAQEKYQRILRMSVNEDPSEKNSLSERSTTKTKQKLVTISEQSKKSEENGWCVELCQKLNLSSSEQVNEIVRILSSNAPHILKENPSNLNLRRFQTDLTNSKISESNLCQQLLLHPPFKPKRLIYLCPDGGIQVLSAVDENLQENSSNNEKNYHLNYSNSAMKSRLPSGDESSVALEFETTTTLTTINMKTGSNNPLMMNEFTSKETLATERDIQLDRSSFDDLLFVPNSTRFPIDFNHNAKTSNSTDPIVNVDFDFQTDCENDDDDNDNDDLLPSPVFKRIIDFSVFE